MLDASLTDDKVQAVIDSMIATNRQTGQHARFVWDAVTAGEGPTIVTLAGLQNWLWYLLPKRSCDEAEVWLEVAGAGAQLFTLLGATLYADTCSSDATRDVFAAWDRSRAAGIKATKAALAAAGVDPPDLADFAWGSIFGSEESLARDAVEVALEAALVDGQFDPKQKGWRETAEGICARVLDSVQVGTAGQTWRTRMLTERAQTWANSPRTEQAQRHSRQSVVNRFLAQPAPPSIDDCTQLFAPLIWLAEQCRDGLTLTASLYLPPPQVRDAAERFQWWDWDKPPRSEADVFQLETLRGFATEMGIVRRKGRQLNTTKKGLTILSEPHLWWKRFVEMIGGDNDYQHAATEIMALLLLTSEPSSWSHVHSAVCDVLAEQNWQTAQGPVSADSHSDGVYRVFHLWMPIQMVDEVRGQWERGPDGQYQSVNATFTLTPGGKLAAEHWLHQRICGPRHSM